MLLGATFITSIALSAGSPITVAAATTWLDRLNAWRAGSGVTALTENTTWDQGDVAHSSYMVKTGLVTHYEDPTNPYYTVAGDTAARNGNIQVNSTTATTDDQAMDWWMTAPFHELGMMDPRLTSTGFGSYRGAGSTWQAGFTLDTLRGNSFTGGTYPVYFPGNGSTEPLTQFNGGEYPDPLQACSGYTAPTGLPITIQVGGNVATTASAHSLTANGAPLAHCVIDSTSPSVGSDVTSRGAVILIPRSPLQAGTTYVVTLTVNGLPYTWSFTVSSNNTIGPAGPPPGWTSLGGIGTSGPGASSWGATHTDVFVRGLDGKLYHNWFNGTSWQGYQSLGGSLNSDPAAVSWGANRIDVFTRGGDNQLWHTWWDGTSWNPWQRLGGSMTSGPDVSSWSTNRLDVFYRGTDNQLWHTWWDGTRWNPAQPLGGILTSDPAAVSWGPNRIDVFARGLDMALWHTWWDGTTWNQWQRLAGNLVSGPETTSCASGHLDVIGVGADGGIDRTGWNGTSWSAWGRIGPWLTSDTAAVCPPGTSSLQIFGKWTDSSIVQSAAAPS
jgi:hypothetical protein